MKKPNYTELGFARSMGTKLKSLVETQLTNDLKNYSIDKTDLRFDWSESCIEGRYTAFLDGSIDRFSGISVYNNQDELVADGWMEFIHHENFFLVYWEYLSTWNGSIESKQKIHGGIPLHIWLQLPESITEIEYYKNMRLAK